MCWGAGLLEDLRCDGLEGAPMRCAERVFLGGNSQCKGPVVGTSLEEGGGNSCGCSSLDKRGAAAGEKGEEHRASGRQGLASEECNYFLMLAPF